MNYPPRPLPPYGWLLAFLFLIVVNIGLAQEAKPEVDVIADTLPAKVVQILTPILVPLLLAVVKQVLPRVPTWVIPLLAPVLGLLIGVIDNLITHSGANLWAAAGLGLLGVAVREVKDTIKPAPNGGWPVTPPPQ